MSLIGSAEFVENIGNSKPVKSWKDLQAIPDIKQAPKVIDFGSLWGELFKGGTPQFPRESETAWGFDQNKDGALELDETVDGLEVTGSQREVALTRPHTFDIHTEPGYTKERLAEDIGKNADKITEVDMFGASLPKNYLPDVHRLLQIPENKAMLIMRMEKESDLWAVSLAVKTDSYKKPTDAERVGYFGRFGRDEKIKYNLSFDSELAKFGIATYRGFIKFPPANDGTNYLRVRQQNPFIK